MKYFRVFLLTAVVACYSIGQLAFAGQREELLEIKNTIVNLVDALVEQGILTAEKAEELKAEAAAKAQADAAAENIAKASDADVVTELRDPPPAPGEKKVVRVPYVPEFVKEEIREQVRAELKEDVTKDVIAKAKADRWGVKDALPEWITRMRWFGDVRLREQSDFFSDDNIITSYPDFDAINDAGGVTRAGADAFFNYTEDRHRLRFRLRLGFETDITESLLMSASLATGNLNNPISLNQTLGNASDPYQLNMESGFLQWHLEDEDDLTWVSVQGGRTRNPYWRVTELVFDNDIHMEGISTNVRLPLPEVYPLEAKTGHRREFFAVVGGYPLDEGEIAFADGSSNDKWIWGVQSGVEFAFTKLHSAKLAFAFFDYINIAGQRNTLGSTIKDWTAPDSVTKGNTMFDIRNDADPTTNLFALASDFQLVNLTAEYRYAGFHPYLLTSAVDVVKNIGFDRREIFRRTGADISERSLGYVVQFNLGWPEINSFGDWSVFGGYRYMQRDAVLDAYTDSNFHLAGTDSQGYFLGGHFGITRDTWVRVRWLSSDEIDGPPLGIDSLQVDLNSQF